MIRFKRTPTAIARDEKGATIVEFALVAATFLTIMFITIEYGLFMMTRVALESVVSQAARTASVSQNVAGCDRVCQVQQIINTKAQSLLNYTSLKITARNLTTGTGSLFAGDLCLTNPPRIGGFCPPFTPWENLGGTPLYDSGPVMTSVGGPGDLIELRVTYPWKVVNPMFGTFFGTNGVAVIESTTVVKNES